MYPRSCSVIDMKYKPLFKKLGLKDYSIVRYKKRDPSKIKKEKIIDLILNPNNTLPIIKPTNTLTSSFKSQSRQGFYKVIIK
jgi:hypothetical protein